MANNTPFRESRNVGERLAEMRKSGKKRHKVHKQE
jgi:hypothetical protein